MPSLDPIDLEEELKAKSSFGSDTPLGEPEGGKYLETADEYIFDIIYTPWVQRPSILVFAVASTDRQAKTRIFRVASDVSYKIVRWNATRLGDWPIIPKVDESEGPLIFRRVIPISPLVNDVAANHFRFVIEGEYIYVLDEPLKDTDPIYAARLPFLSTDKTRRAVEESDQEDLTSPEAQAS